MSKGKVPTRVITETGALGIIETFFVPSGGIIEAADAAVKAANVQLLQIHLAMAIGGKATPVGDM